MVAVTGASRGYAFIEYEREKEMRHAYEVIICFLVQYIYFHLLVNLLETTTLVLLESWTLRLCAF